MEDALPPADPALALRDAVISLEPTIKEIDAEVARDKATKDLLQQIEDHRSREKERIDGVQEKIDALFAEIRALRAQIGKLNAVRGRLMSQAASMQGGKRFRTGPIMRIKTKMQMRKKVLRKKLVSHRLSLLRKSLDKKYAKSQSQLS